MATAGCGDVLAGMVAAHVAGKGADVYEGTVYAVHHHSFAGDLAAENLGKRGILAGDIIDYISNDSVDMVIYYFFKLIKLIKFVWKPQKLFSSIPATLAVPFYLYRFPCLLWLLV